MLPGSTMAFQMQTQSGAEMLVDEIAPFPTTGRVYKRHLTGDCRMEFAIEESMPKLVEGLQQGMRIILLDAVPNSGKSKYLPAELAKLGYEVLLLAPQVGDLVDLHQRLSRRVPCRISAGQHFRMLPQRFSGSGVHVLSVGLGALWIHSPADWTSWWKRFDVVLCDEAHFTQTNFVYGHLITELMQLMPRASFVLMSGTLPSSLHCPTANQLHITCHNRKFALDCYYVVVADKYTEAVSLACWFLQCKRPVIIFVAGKQEIADTKAAMQERGVPQEDIEAIHGDMSAKEIEQRTQSGRVKAYVCTNVGRNISYDSRSSCDQP